MSGMRNFSAMAIMRFFNRANGFYIVCVVTFMIAMFMYWLEQSFISNVSFLIFGVLVAFVVEDVRGSVARKRRTKDLSLAIYQELANRLARCVFDFESPWESWMDPANCPSGIELARLRKFIPISPVIYPATASEIGLLGNEVPQPLIRFYVALAIYQQDMNHVVDFCQRNSLQFVPPAMAAMLAERLRRTLSPGLQALRAFTNANLVEDYGEIDRQAIADSDILFQHARSSLPLRARIEHYVKN